jgi:preprotein translocase subunit YajC
MKLNYRDKIIAAILIAITILLVGFFALIKPKYKDIKAHQKNLKEVQKTEADIRAQIAEIPDLKSAILKIHEDTSVITAKFVPINDVQNPVVIDKYMQKFAEETKVKLLKVELKEAKLTPIEYYYNSVNDNFADMRKSADIDGSLGKAYAEQTAESTAVSQRAKESVMQTQYGINIHGTKKNVWAYLAALEKFDKTLTVNSVTITDYSFGKNAAEAANISIPDSKDADEETVVEGGENGKISNASDVRIVVTLYSVYEMAKPNVD